jgi:copper(I)-binding protein
VLRTDRSRLLVLVVAFAAVALAACGSSEGDAAGDSSSGGIEVSDAWVRASPDGATTGAAYMVISSEDGDRLVSASVPTDVAGSTEVHETVAAESSDDMSMDDESMDDESMDDAEMDDMSSDDTSMDDDSEMSGMGGMTMREVSGIDIPAGGSVSLEPGGYHVMLLDLKAPLTEGETVSITLTFENAGTVEVEAPVRSS